MAAIASLGGIEIQPIPSHAAEKKSIGAKKRRWWVGLSLDRQKQILASLDPKYNPESPYQHNVKEFNKELKRIKRAEDRWIEDLKALRLPCFCRACLQYGRSRFPAYYVKFMLAYECWLERQQENRERMAEAEPDLVHELLRLEGSNDTHGAKLVRIRDFA